MSIRVAVIDAYPIVTWGLERLIDGEAPRMCCVGSAQGPEAARGLLVAQGADVVLLDLDGQGSVDLIADFAGPAMRFIVLTGVRDDVLRQQAVLAGACGLLGLEESPATILRAIGRVHAGELWLGRAQTGNLVEALRRGASEKVPDPFASLTARERQIVAVLLKQNGGPNRKVAESLGISEKTLRNALSTIYSKTGVDTRLQLFTLAARHPPQR